MLSRGILLVGEFLSKRKITGKRSESAKYLRMCSKYSRSKSVTALCLFWNIGVSSWRGGLCVCVCVYVGGGVVMKSSLPEDYRSFVLEYDYPVPTDCFEGKQESSQVATNPRGALDLKSRGGLVLWREQIKCNWQMISPSGVMWANFCCFR